MGMMVGVCAHCGQAHMVDSDTQPGADRIATHECTCEGAQVERRKRKAMRKLLDRMAAPKAVTGFDPMPEAAREAVEELAGYIFDGEIRSARVDTGDRIAELKQNTEGFTFRQSRKIEDTEEC